MSLVLAQYLYLPGEAFPAFGQTVQFARDFLVLLQDQLVIVCMAIEIRVRQLLRQFFTALLQ